MALSVKGYPSSRVSENILTVPVCKEDPKSAVHTVYSGITGTPNRLGNLWRIDIRQPVSSESQYNLHRGISTRAHEIMKT